MALIKKLVDLKIVELKKVILENSNLIDKKTKSACNSIKKSSDFESFYLRYLIITFCIIFCLTCLLSIYLH